MCKFPILNSIHLNRENFPTFFFPHENKVVLILTKNLYISSLLFNQSQIYKLILEHMVFFASISNRLKNMSSSHHYYLFIIIIIFHILQMPKVSSVVVKSVTKLLLLK